MYQEYRAPDTALLIRHIPGINNTIADILSRIYSPKPVNNQVLQDLLDNYQWEMVPHSYFDLSLYI